MATEEMHDHLMRAIRALRRAPIIRSAWDQRQSQMTRLFHRFAADDARLRTVIGIREQDLIRVYGTKGGVALYGPYIDLLPGNYEAVIHFDPATTCRGTATMDVCSGIGVEVLGRQTFTAKQVVDRGMCARIRFSCSQALLNVEVRLFCEGDFAAAIRSVEILGDELRSSPAMSLKFSDLPVVQVPNAIRRGRNLCEGYQRGIGLTFQDLGAKIIMDPDFQRAHEFARDRTVVGRENLWNIFLLFKFYLPRLPFGHIVEFGSYRGGCAIFMSALAQKFLPEARVFGFDTFCGMPATDSAVDFHQSGDFADVDLGELRQYVEQIGLQNLTFVQGSFEDTAPRKLEEIGTISFCHIDCDIRTAIECAYDVAKPYMVSGGYWVFDDPLQATCLGATEAVEELLIRRDGLNSEQVVPHYVFREPFRRQLLNQADK